MVRFVSGDWGSSHLRLRLVDGDGSVKNEIKADCGSLKLAAKRNREQAYRSALARYLKKLDVPRDLPIVLSGTASSSIGWKELPYAKLPFALDGSSAVWEKIDHRVYLISGACSDADMMRGEETETLGVAAVLGRSMPPDAVLVLPGTHSKHITIGGGSITSIRTYMTGELFEILPRHTILRHSTETSACFDRQAFLQGVEESTKQGLSSGIFRVRTREVLQKCEKTSNMWFLSGLLIGSELLALKDTNTDIILAASDPLLTPYETAIEGLGFEKRLTKVNSEIISILGQQVLLQRFFCGPKKNAHNTPH